MKKTAVPLFGPLLSRVGALRLKREATKCHNVEDYMDLAFNFRIGSLHIRPLQIKEEIVQLLRLLTESHPKIVCEIGTANGGTLFLFSRVSSPSATIISIDLPRGRFGGGYPEWKIPFYKSFMSHKQKICLIRGDSHSPTTIKTVRNILKGRKVDFLFIDGDHTYNGVKTDFEVYSKFVKQGGIIALHDIVPHPPELGCQVNKFWMEIKGGYRHVEIVRDRRQKWAGIGMVYKE